MIFISDVHHGLSGLRELPTDKGPLVILGDLINWIDYRNGDGIAKEVFGLENVQKLINLRKEARKLGITLEEPFLQLAFLALPVIPHLKITDMGLVDVNRFEIIK